MSAADDTVDVAGHIFFHGKSAEIVAGFFCFPDNEALVSVLTAGFPFKAMETAVAERFNLAASSFAVIPMSVFLRSLLDDCIYI